jgi:hypothetical protein
VVERIFRVSDLKKFATEEGLRTTGTKSDLIARLIASARPKMEQITENVKVLNCSPLAKEVVAEFAPKQRAGAQSREAAMFRVPPPGQCPSSL